MNRHDIDTIRLIGISHKTAPVEIREKFTFSRESVPAVLESIRRTDGVRECVLVSTCNRTEIYYTFMGAPRASGDAVDRMVLDAAGCDTACLDRFYFLRGRKAVEHLFSVACGFDSLVIGETQIFGQLKAFYALACDSGCTGTVFNRLFHLSFRAGKQIRSTTSVGEGVVSVSSAAVMLARKVSGGLNGKNVLLIGAGKIGKLCAQQLTGAGIGELLITNRTIERAEALAGDLPGTVVPFEKIPETIGAVDIVVTSVTSPTPLITKTLLAKHLEGRGAKPIIFIDMGVPRNVAPEAADLENVHVFNIDDLEEITRENRDRRLREKDKAGAIIDDMVDEFGEWLKEQEVIPAINSLRAKCENIRIEELGRISNKVSAETYEVIEIVTRRIVRKILHNPIITMRTSECGESRRRLIESIHELFIADPAD